MMRFDESGVENGWTWLVLDVNPEPWRIGPLSVGRRSGKVFPMVGRDTQLHYYEQAIKEELGDGWIVYDGPVELKFFFWRNRAEYTTPQARTHRKHEADGTNMAKATEDALQGILFKNDKDTNKMEWTIVEQGPDVTPRVVIAFRPGHKPTRFTLPDQVMDFIESFEELETDNSWG